MTQQTEAVAETAQTAGEAVGQAVQAVQALPSAEQAAEHVARDSGTGLASAAEAVVDTTHWFIRFFQNLTEGITAQNLIMQVTAVVLAFVLGIVLSRRATAWLEARRPGRHETGVMNHLKHLAFGLLENVSFGLIAGSILALCSWLMVVVIGEPARTLVLCRIFYSIFYAFSVLSIVLAFLQASIGAAIISRGFQRSVTVVFWCLAVLQFFGILSDLVAILDSTSIPIGKGDMTLWKLIMAVFSVLLTLAVGNWISGIINQFIRGAGNLTPNLKVVLARIVSVACIVLAVIIGLGTVGIDLTILSVFGGALGVGLGFGLQKIASNYVSGFIILLDKSIKIGDLVTVGGFRGKVVEINTRFTVVRSADGIESIVPNESFVTTAVLNHSYTDQATTAYVEISVAYDADVDRALQIMVEEAGRERPRIARGRKAWACVDSFGDSGINLKAAFWVADPVNGTAGLKTQIALAIYRRLVEEKIEVPYNRLEVTLLNGGAPAAAAADKPSA